MQSVVLKTPAFNASKMIVRNMSTAGKISNVVIVGGGLMGSGIAQVAATTNHGVAIVDVKDAFLKAAHSRIENSLRRVAKKEFADSKENAHKYVNDTLSKMKFIEGVDEAKDVIGSADLVIEAVTENLEAKRPLFVKFDKMTKKDCILVSNTSSIQISEIMAPIASRKDRCGGLHFFNPVPMMKLVEVVSLPETSAITNQKLTAFCKALGKTPVQCKDTPGFIVNRLLIPYLIQAVQMYERGDASKEDIDTAMKLGAGYPMGPFELLDYVGLDTSKFITDIWSSCFRDDPQLSVRSALLDKLVSENKLGMKTGEGFYKHTKK